MMNRKSFSLIARLLRHCNIAEGFFFYACKSNVGKVVALLVRVLYISLIFLVESRHDGIITFRHAAIDVFRPLSFGIDGLVDGKAYGVPCYPFAVPCSWHDVERAVNC